MIQTLREDPGDAEIDSHKLMVRAGLMKKAAGGLYTYLPLGMRVLNKVQRIVREEMDRAGAQEIVMPILQPAELWKTSGRWESMGPGMFRLKDRGAHDYALSPTAEEMVTDLVKGVVSSYRQLPVTVYQIQWKFRDEIRPRFGLMRSKEFLMKDAYSFDVSLDAADASYMAMFEAYKRVFARCGLKAYPVEADTGDIGGKFSHEFHVLAAATPPTSRRPSAASPRAPPRPAARWRPSPRPAPRRSTRSRSSWACQALLSSSPSSTSPTASRSWSASPATATSTR